MQQRFIDKVVVIIGGNSGIGLAAAKAFAHEGARVVITGRDSETLETAAHDIGHGVRAHCSDISDLQQIAVLFSKLRDSFERVDVLFVNAGVALHRHVESVTEADWDWILGTNLKGVFFTVQAALPLMSRGASIVLTGSVAAMKGEPGVSLYASSKAGLRALGRSLACEFVARGIRVNVISPGPVDTPIHHRVRGLPAETVGMLWQAMVDTTPMKRLGTPEEVAAAVLFLASDGAAFITGIDLLVDGGSSSI